MNEPAEPSAALPPLDSACGAAFCPDCRASLAVTGGLLPEACPACSRPLRMAKPGPWAALALAFHQYATFSGRATRAEYWGFAAAVLLVDVALLLAAVLVGGAFVILLENAGLGMLGALLVMLALCLWGCALIIPACSLCVRRLHDTGHSAWWFAALYILSHVAPMLGDTTEPFLHVMQEHSAWYTPQGETTESCPLCQWDAGTWDSDSWTPAQTVRACVSMLVPEPSSVRGMAALACWAASFGLSVWIFYLMCADSQRGQNAYGPSSKYPLG